MMASMDFHAAYEWLVAYSKETAYLRSFAALAGWDQQTYAPPKGMAHRAQMFAVIAKIVHQRSSDPRIGEILAVVEASDLAKDPRSSAAANIREWRREYDQTIRIPERLAVELAEASSAGQSFWSQARPKNDWQGFVPYLRRMLALKREQAGALGYAKEPYDALLDQYEPGETASGLEPLFARLRKELSQLLGQIQHAPRKPGTSVLRRTFSQAGQQAFEREVLRRVGYDLEGGRVDPTQHPFESSIGPGDVRLATRYDVNNFNEFFFSTLHECGHGLYEQGLDAGHFGTPMGQAVSLGIHESQSRTWENLVGRSLGFWRYWYPKAQRHFAALEDVSLETFHFAVNAVEPSLIRVEADEVTYNLHILIRFELELALMRGQLEVEDLPEAWNQKYREHLGVTPPDHKDGVMQDVHWSEGYLGYFPTYTLGNLYAAQFFQQAQRELGDLESQFQRGEFATFLNWSREKIHRQGSRLLPRDLVREVTGEDLNPEPLLEYLQQKYRALYGL